MRCRPSATKTAEADEDDELTVPRIPEPVLVFTGKCEWDFITGV